MRHTTEELETLALQIHPDHRAGEAALLRTRWFDYHQMHPVEATYHYAAAYVEQTRLWVEKTIDAGEPERPRPFTPDDIFKSRDLTSMWLARRAADALGIPYNFVMQFTADRALVRYFSRFPRPNMLYGEEFEGDLADAWKLRLSQSMVWGTHPNLHASKFAFQAEQERHLGFVVDQVRTRPAPQHRLLARLLHEDVLNETQVAMHFGDRMLDDARRYAGTLVAA
jgi:hypothetical protein